MAKTSSKVSSKRSASTEQASAPRSGDVIATMSVADLETMLQQRRQQETETLTAKREELLKQVAEVDEQLAALGVGNGRRGGGRKRGGSGTRAPRAKNEVPLNQVVHNVLAAAKKPMHIKDIIEEVKKTDYKTNSSNWYSLVYTALKNEEMFKRQGEKRDAVYSAIPASK